MIDYANLAEGGAGLLLIGAAFVGCNRTGAVLLLTLAIGAGGGICGSTNIFSLT